MPFRTMMQKRGSTYNFRKKVPSDLKKIVVKHEIVRSVGSNPEVAKRKIAELEVE